MARSLIFNFLFLFAFIYNYASGCRKWTCKLPEQDFLPDTCMNYNELSNAWYLRKCPDSNSHCAEDHGYLSTHNYTCSQPPVNVPNFGNPCRTSDDCPHSILCKNGFCTWIPEDGRCKDVGSCTPGYYCNGHSCAPQIKIGETGCKIIHDCVNNAACNITSLTDPTKNTCYAMMSFKVHDPVSHCRAGINELCPYFSCAFNYKDGGYYCTDLLKTAKGEGVECNPNEDDGSCDSHPDNFFDPPYIAKGRCYCSFNNQGTGHCSPLHGDPVFVELNKQLSKWIQSEEILKCHTIWRLGEECLKNYWNTRDYNIFKYYLELSNHLHDIIGAEECVLETHPSLRKYWEAKKAFDNDASNEIIEPKPEV